MYLNKLVKQQRQAIRTVSDSYKEAIWDAYFQNITMTVNVMYTIELCSFMFNYIAKWIAIYIDYRVKRSDIHKVKDKT